MRWVVQPPSRAGTALAHGLWHATDDGQQTLCSRRIPVFPWGVLPETYIDYFEQVECLQCMRRITRELRAENEEGA